MKGRRFHIIFTLRYLRYGLLLCLVPMLRALVEFDLDSLWLALTQDAAILLASAAAALVLWHATSFAWQEGAVQVSQGVVLRQSQTFSRQSIAALEIVRPLSCRLLGASRVTLYFRANAAPRRYTLYLKKRDAAAVAEALLPVCTENAVFEPTGFERLAFIMLSANILTSSLFALWGVRQADELLDGDFGRRAAQTLREAALFVARFLPAGFALLLTLGFAVTGDRKSVV